MPKISASRGRRNSYPALVGIATVVLIVGTLYLARDFLMPIALATLLAFMLNPLVSRLCRWGLPRVLSVIIMTTLTFAFLGTIVWLLGRQTAALANELPNYTYNIKKRVQAVQSVGSGGFIEKMRKMGTDVGVLESPDSAPEPGKPEKAENDKDSKQTVVSRMEGLAASALNFMVNGLAAALGVSTLVILYGVFMLLRHEDISKRITRLAGYNRLTATTRALDDVSDRVSHYLLMQGTVNSIYGVLVGASLALIGLPYALLWGVLGALFRYIPYIGPILVATLPITFSLAFFPGWSQPLMVIGVILTLELITNMMLEPVLYGKSTGVSDFALIIAIGFWTWLWGAIGLVLATPLTVCLVVFCKYIPALHWVETLMGDSPEPTPHLVFYQRLISERTEEFYDDFEEVFEEEGLKSALDKLLLPALALIRQESQFGHLTHEEQVAAYTELRHTVVQAKELQRDSIKENAEAGESEPVPDEASTKPRVKIFARALHGEADALALELLGACLPPDMELEVSREPHLIGELIQELETKKPSLVCIGALPPDAESSAAFLCRRIRSRLPNLKIVVCAWKGGEAEYDTRPFREAGAHAVATTLAEAESMIDNLTHA